MSRVQSSLKECDVFCWLFADRTTPTCVGGSLIASPTLLLPSPPGHRSSSAQPACRQENLIARPQTKYVLVVHELFCSRPCLIRMGALSSLTKRRERGLLALSTQIVPFYWGVFFFIGISSHLVIHLLEHVVYSAV